MEKSEIEKIWDNDELKKQFRDLSDSIEKLNEESAPNPPTNLQGTLVE